MSFISKGWICHSPRAYYQIEKCLLAIKLASGTTPLSRSMLSRGGRRVSAGERPGLQDPVWSCRKPWPNSRHYIRPISSDVQVIDTGARELV